MLIFGSENELFPFIINKIEQIEHAGEKVWILLRYRINTLSSTSCYLLEWQRNTRLFCWGIQGEGLVVWYFMSPEFIRLVS